MSVSGDYLCVTVWSKPGEAEADFKTRLSAFWTGMLRNHPDEFERVYAETARFDDDAGRLSRQYLVEAEAADWLERELTAGDVEFAPIDRDDVFTKYEATPPDWMWIEH